MNGDAEVALNGGWTPKITVTKLSEGKMIDSAKTAASLQQSEDAFVRELPSLLRDHEGKWIAYHGFRRVTLADTKSEVYAECYRQGLSDDDFLVRCIEPQLEETILGPDAQTS